MKQKKSFCIVCHVVFAAVFFSVFCEYGFCQTSSETKQIADANLYLQAIEKTKGLPIEKQIALWQMFLEEYPKFEFRTEIEENIKQLNRLLDDTDPDRRKGQKDSERYLKAVGFSKKLSLMDQIALWRQFLEENPNSLYRKEALTQLERAKARMARQTNSRQSNAPKIIVKVPSKSEPVVQRLPYKDLQTTTLLATFAGLVVPGIGHWYTHDFVIAGLLTAMRAGGLLVGVPGLIQRNSAMIISGALLSGCSYLIDVVDAPFAAERFNTRKEKSSSISVSLLSNAGDTGWTKGIYLQVLF